MNRIGWAVVVMSVGAGACASAPPPNDRMASSEAAIRGAREVGAEQIPQGALELKLAQEELEKAKALMRDGDNSAASFMLLRSQADAELALALAREAKTHAEAQLAIDKVRAIGGGPQAPAPQAPTHQTPPQTSAPQTSTPQVTPAPAPRPVP